eukprot:7982606-Pyramimonas_sp.AAC.1
MSTNQAVFALRASYFCSNEVSRVFGLAAMWPLSPPRRSPVAARRLCRAFWRLRDRRRRLVAALFSPLAAGGLHHIQCTKKKDRACGALVGSVNHIDCTTYADAAQPQALHHCDCTAYVVHHPLGKRICCATYIADHGLHHADCIT